MHLLGVGMYVCYMQEKLKKSASDFSMDELKKIAATWEGKDQYEVALNTFGIPIQSQQKASLDQIYVYGLGVYKLSVGNAWDNKENLRAYMKVIPFPEHVENLEGPELLKVVRAYPKSFLPMVDRQYEYHYLRDRSSRLRKKNLSWGAGVLSGNRPYFAEYWNLHQLGTLRHFLTLYITSEGIEKEGLRDADLIHALGLEELAESADGGHPYAEVATYTDHSGKEFFTLRMLIIEEWGKTVMRAPEFCR